MNIGEHVTISVKPQNMKATTCTNTHTKAVKSSQEVNNEIFIYKTRYRYSLAIGSFF